MFRLTAHIYDLIYEAEGKDYAAESAVLVQLINARSPGARSVLDVACGTGGHLRYLKDLFEISGIDVDPGMLEIARMHVLSDSLLLADMREFDLGRTFDVVVCLFSSIGYMANVLELGAACRTMARHLRPNGLIIIDGWVRPDQWHDGRPPHITTASNTDTTVVRMAHSWRDGTKTHLELHHLVGTRSGVEYLVDEHVLTLFERDEYRDALLGNGFVDFEIVEGPMPGRDRYLARRSSLWVA